MDKNQILEILEDWNLWRKELKSGYEREEYLKSALKFLKPNVILSFIGVRRSGKSYLMRQLAKKLIAGKIEKNSILIINFEDGRFTKFNLDLLDKIYETYVENLNPKDKPYIFLDEIHKIPKWEKWARTMHELNKAKIIVSGSSSELMSGELATVLTGRHLDINVFPLSFKEFICFKGLEIKNKLDLVSKKLEIKKLLKEYLEFGGFPEIVLNEEKKILLLTYFDDILTEDIEKRYKIREGEKLRALAKFYLTNISNLITFNSLKKYLELSTDTIEKFSSYFEKNNLLFFIKSFSFKIKEQEKSPRKVYSIDTGLSNAIGFKFSSNIGNLYENIVAIELKKEIMENANIEMYYWKNIKHEEVDFVLKEGLKVKQLIQVCYNLEDIKTKERELKALLKCSKELRCNNLIVLNENYEKEEKVENKNIKFIPLWKWLLE
ncbi:ATP-binding protein [Candidatus Woesearchaeota archaeon]|nr:ATP-binding protein [Candidatus Woesearchaeota archaeon]